MLKTLKEKFIEIDFIRYNIGIASGGEEWGKRTKRQKIEKNTVQRSYSRKPVIFVSARCSKFRGQFSGSSRHVGLEDTNFENEVLLDLTFFSPFFNNVPCSVNPNFFFFLDEKDQSIRERTRFNETVISDYNDKIFLLTNFRFNGLSRIPFSKRVRTRSFGKVASRRGR